ncbi:MAG: hypothetical protein Q9170_005395 [Blastenia crenularia]
MDPSHQRYQGFLSGRRLDVTKQVINFKDTELPEYEGYYACILDNVLSANECSNLVRAAKAQTNGEWQQATINAGYSGQQIDAESRLCGRMIWDNEELAARIWARCIGHVPEILELKDRPGITGGGHLTKDWLYRLVGLNPSMRFLRYFDGNYFRRESTFSVPYPPLTNSAHFDGTFSNEENQVSFLTLHLYLNEADEDSMLEGGATSFHALDWSGRQMDVMPKVGRVLLFQQKGLLHSGADVKRGIKLTMRTDVLYKKAE